MRRDHRILAMLICAVLICCACFSAPAETANAEKLTVSGSHFVAKGKEITLTAGEAVTWKSSDKKIATVSRKGVVTGIRAGEVKITAVSKANPRVKKVWKITVTRHAVRQITLTASAKVLNLQGVTSATITASASPESAAQSFTWKSSDKKIAKVNGKGVVTAVAEGTAVITATATDGSGKKASVEITVRDGEETFTVKNGATRKITIDLPPSVSARSLIWRSSDEHIFTVDRRGHVFGNYPGKAVLTVSTPEGQVIAKIKVVVQANYRALLFSESTFAGGVIGRNRGDVRLMTNMLATVTGPDGGEYKVTSFDDLVADEVYQKIDKYLIQPSRDGDVSMFFFASHGDYHSSTEKLAGRLWCRNKETWLELPTLAKKLSKVKGKVIVLLESCGPGAALHEFEKDPKPNDAPEGEEDPEDLQNDAAFSGAVIRAFSGTDPGLEVYGTEEDRGDTESNAKKYTFRTKKFLVMTASAYRQMSYYVGVHDCNLFPYWLVRGVGTKGRLPADILCGDRDGRLTLQELYKFVYNNTIYKQAPQVYPANCNDVLFLRRN